MKDTLIIIPTYNNAGTLENVLERCQAQGLPILVVDDGSTDATPAILDGMGPDLEVIRHKVNMGKGNALKTGFLEARRQGYAYALTIDSDGQHFPEDIPALLAAKGERTLVVGSRSQMGADGGGSFANRFSNFWFTVQTARRLPDTQTGFRVYPLAKIGRHNPLNNRYEAELELLVRCAWRNVDIKSCQINVYYPPKNERVSHFRPTMDFVRISLLNTALCLLAVVYGYPSMAVRKIVKKLKK